MSGAKNGIAPVTHIAQVFKFVHHAEVIENADSGHEVGQTVSLDSAVNLKSFIANTDNHAVSAQGTVGILCQGGEYFVVVGERAFALDDLRVHGVLSGCDVAELGYILKYLRKAVQA